MHRQNILRTTLILILMGLSLVTGPHSSVFALPPQDDLTPGQLPETPTIVGVVSTAIRCLAAGAIDSEEDGQTGVCPTTDAVELYWQGDAERAQLVMSIPDLNTAPQAAHSIRVNGNLVALSPVCSAAQPCSPGETFYFSIPPEAVQQGTNQIELTADGQTDNLWVATNVRLKVLGAVTPVQQAPAQSDDMSAADVSAASSFVVTFQNSLDGTNQEAIAQIPSGYNPSNPVPLIVFAHARSRTMEDGTDVLGAAANSRGWLLISPQMHGNWPIPPQCYIYPNNCEYDDQVLTGTTGPGADPRPGAWAHASRESQYDVVGAAKYMIDHYNVKKDQIYLVGGSMGGQTTGVTAAKFPHIFAAAYDYMGISNLGQWYWELDSAFDRKTLAKECHINTVQKSPTENPFCYERRSPIAFARNLINTPISLTHSIHDQLVPISHSRNLKTDINYFDPNITVELYEEKASFWRCEPPYHCLDPNEYAVLRYLDDFALDNNPTHIRIAADESKLFYWMNLTQSGSAHMSYVDVTRDPDSPSVEVTTNDTSAVTIGLNLGTGSRLGEVMQQPGMGYPSTTYLVKGAGYYKLVDYVSGYLSTQINTTGQNTFTVSALDVDVEANPSVVSNDQSHISTITIQVRDSSDQANPVPNGTQVQLHTTEGLFGNGQQNQTLTTSNGLAVTTLTVNPTDDLAEITATVRQATGTATVDVIQLGIGIEAQPASQTVYAGVPFSMFYRVTNEGDSTLNSVSVIDDDGRGAQIPVCSGLTLAPHAFTTCHRNITLSSSATIHAQATGQSPAGDQVIDSDSIQITVIAPSIGLISSPNPLVVYDDQPGSLTYEVTNTGDTALTSVKIQDDLGGGSSTVCTLGTMQPGAKKTCTRSVELVQSTTISSTATGSDQLLNPVRAGHSNPVTVISPAIEVQVSPEEQTSYPDTALPGRCTVRNTGNTTLTSVVITHNGGTPFDPSDDVILRQGLTLSVGQTESCGAIVPQQSGTFEISARGDDPLRNAVRGTDSIVVTLISPKLTIQVTPQQVQVEEGKTVSLRYTLVNSGDVDIEQVMVRDDNGTPANSSDDYDLFSSYPADMPAGATWSDGRTLTAGQTLTIIATATGKDPLDKDVTVQIQALVIVGGRVYLPFVVQN